MSEKPVYMPPSDEEMAALFRVVCDECPELRPPDDERYALAQDVVGITMELAVKWASDVDKALMANGGNAAALVASELMAYGALSAIFKSHPQADLRRQLYAAGLHVGKFIVERWAANARQQSFRKDQGSPD